MRFFVCILVLLFVHNQFSRADKTLTEDSLYTEKYIRDIYIPEPRRALQLLDEAENRKTIPLRVVNELRSLSYSNMYMNKLAFMYARKAYLLDSIGSSSNLVVISFFISTVFFFLNPIKSCRYVCFLVTLKTPHH